MAKNTAFKLMGETIKPGEERTLNLPVAGLYTHTGVHVPVHIINGKQEGPRLFVTATIHGDEINGVEIIRRLLKLKRIRRIKGTLILVPIVNVFGFLNLSRYLPDRRDLNRSFPGSQKGSLAARLAYALLNEIVKQCTHGIDLHTASLHRTNLPQTRVNLDTPGAKELAEAFEAPVILNANLRDGSLRQMCAELKIPMIVYESGEALRFDEFAIRHGVRGVVHTMEHLGMLRRRYHSAKKQIAPLITSTSVWVRASWGGIVLYYKHLGEQVIKGDKLGAIVDPLGFEEKPIIATISGILIGKLNLPLVNEGDAIYHIAAFKPDEVNISQLEQLINLEAPMPGEGMI